MEWNLCCDSKETSHPVNSMEADLVALLSSPHTPSHATIARYIEPHLPLIKSRMLNALYTDLRYHRATYTAHIPQLVQESITDYRLEAVLKQVIGWMRMNSC